jgi:hypothetical protein
MPVIISFLLFLSGLLGIYMGQRIIKNQYDFFFRKAQPEDLVVHQTIFVWGDDGSFQKKVISNILIFGNDWKAFETSDGCQYVLGECFIKIEGQRSSIGEAPKEKWASREDLDQHGKIFGKPIKQLENNTEKE